MESGSTGINFDKSQKFGRAAREPHSGAVANGSRVSSAVGVGGGMGPRARSDMVIDMVIDMASEMAGGAAGILRLVLSATSRAPSGCSRWCQSVRRPDCDSLQGWAAPTFALAPGASPKPLLAGWTARLDGLPAG